MGEYSVQSFSYSPSTYSPSTEPRLGGRLLLHLFSGSLLAMTFSLAGPGIQHIREALTALPVPRSQDSVLVTSWEPRRAAILNLRHISLLQSFPGWEIRPEFPSILKQRGCLPKNPDELE